MKAILKLGKNNHRLNRNLTLLLTVGWEVRQVRDPRVLNFPLLMNFQMM